MQTRHEYAAEYSLDIITDNNNEFFAVHVTTETGIGITENRDDIYTAVFCNADGETIGRGVGRGPTMDEALASRLCA